MNYNKPPRSFSDQINILESRGLKIHNKIIAEHFLSNISYYRLSAYMKSFQKYGDPNHTFIEGVTFSRIMDLYSFDRDLRLLLMDAIERIEVAFRCSFIYEYSIRHGNNWYEDLVHFQRGHSKSMKVVQSEIDNCKEVFIEHYKKTYTNPANPPSFMTFEILSFGQLSILYKNTVVSDAKKAVAAHFGIHYLVLESWIEHLVYIRNLCAHHSRVWNRDLIINRPIIPSNTNFLWVSIPPSRPDKLYTTLCLIVYMLRRINPTSSFTGRLQCLLKRHPLVNIDNMGIPYNWENDNFWKTTYIPWNQSVRLRLIVIRSWFIKTNYVVPIKRLTQP